MATLFPSNLAWLGIAKETTYGTPVATPTVWIPVMNPKWTPHQTQLQDDALRGDMAKVHNVVQGTRYDTMDYDTYLYLDSIFPHMLAVLGTADTITGASDPYTHKTSLVNNTTSAQPPSYTLNLFNGAESWQMAGSVLGKADVDLKANELAKLTANWTGLPAVKVANPANTPTTAKPWASWNTTITINSVAATNYSDAKLSYTREIEQIQTLDGNVAPYQVFVGPLMAEIQVTGIYQGYAGTPTDLSNLLTNTQVPVVVKVNPVGDATHYAQWQHTLAAGDASEPKVNTGKYVEIDTKYIGVANTTDATGGGSSPVQFILLTSASTAF